MSTYQHILVGLDLSEDSEAVLAKAKKIADDCNATLSVVHVIEPLAFAYGGDMPIDLSEAQKTLEDQAKKRLQALANHHDIPQSKQIVSLGHTSSELHELAKEHNADLIAVGSHGRHGLAMLLGSTAKGVIGGAECDVLAIRV